MKNLISHYDAFIIDVWGVIIGGVSEGIKAYPGVVDCLNHLIASQKSIIFLSNAALPGHIVVKGLTQLGIQVSPEMVLTSGDLIREQFVLWNDPVFSQLPKQFYHLCDEEHKDILADIQTEEVKHLAEAGFVLLSAHMAENLTQYDTVLQTAIDYNLPMVCANPDKIAVEDDIVWYCPGFLAEKYQTLGGIVHYYGKPHSFVYDIAFKQFKNTGITDKKRILMIGDTLETDILGAKTANIDSALVMTGNTGRLLKEGLTLEHIISKSGINPTWTIESCALTAINLIPSPSMA